MNQKLLNQTDIYTLLYNGNVMGAKRLFCERFETYKDEFSRQELKEFLHSLNFGIYHFILFSEHTPLDECCCQNHKAIHNAVTDFSELYQVGINLIHNYGYCTDYLINRYNNMPIRHALRHIHENLSEFICLEQLAKHVSLSKNQLCFLFREETGRTICNYITERRIQMAKELLRKGNLGIELIAELCGFTSSSYFCTVFKKETKKTPLQFRKEKVIN